MPATAALAKRFGVRVRELRKARGLSRDSLAHAIGVRPAALARIERGERFNCANLAPLAEALGVQARDLFDFDPIAATEGMRRIAQLLEGATAEEIALAERILRAALSKH